MADDVVASTAEPIPVDGSVDENLDAQKVFTAAEEDAESCRICRGEATPEQPLFYPCKCSGSIRFVHQDCLMEWLSHSQKKYCELCKTPFRFTKLYDQFMPQTLPLPLFLRQIILYVTRASFRWTRYTVVAFIWSCLLPWVIRLIWRGLFFLADGTSTSSIANAVHDAALTNLTLAAENNTVAISQPMGTGHSAHLAINWTSSGFSMSALGSQTILGLPIRQLLLLKLVEGIWPSIFTILFSIMSSDPGDHPLILLAEDRQPSILSEVDFIKTIMTNSIFGGALVDVLEGQLICLSIITAFILVFLIREWVINQQPVANMPDPDHADNHAPVAVENVAVAQRHRLRALRNRGAGNPGADVVGDPPQADGPRLMAVPRRQRQIVEAENSQEHVQAQLDQILGAASDITGESIVNGQAPTSRPITPQDPDHGIRNVPDPRPPPLVRGALDLAAVIQRDMEEMPQRASVDGSPDGNQHTEIAAEHPRPSSAPLADVADTADHGDNHLRRLEELRCEWRELSNRLDDAFGEASTDNPFAPPGMSNFSAFSNTRPARSSRSSTSSEGWKSQPLSPCESCGIDENGDMMVRDLDGLGTEEGASAPSTSSQDVDDLVTTADYDDLQAVEDEAPPRANDSEQNVQSSSKAEMLMQWMWHVDDQRPVIVETNGEDIEHIVQDPAAEAPFVPVRNRAGQAENAVQNAHREQNQHPAPQPPNMFWGIDLNDPDAVDEIEDMEGVLDLIGMQGPIHNMLINLVFSLLLIILIIAASVWLPYVWGKIALLILANPFAFFITAPLHVASKAADIAIDLTCFTVALLAILGTTAVGFLRYPLMEVAPRLASWLKTTRVDALAHQVAQRHGKQLEHSLTRTVMGLRPDLATFSTQSHYSLRLFQKQISSTARLASIVVRGFIFDVPSRTEAKSLLSSFSLGKTELYTLLAKGNALLQGLSLHAARIIGDIRTSSLAATRPTYTVNSSSEHELVSWTTQDRILAIVLGYMVFAILGFIYLRIERLVLGSKIDENANGIIGDGVRQAGGVLKVVVIIGIEMIIFPLYCGFLLDIALLPLFEGATMQSRISFMIRAPITGLFVHWFIGTCYMFHFALFVSMCRTILRTGVLYFIRDPDDPTFHPVRDVLERPVATQLGKIAFSAIIYGGLVILCLGGVIWMLSGMNGILPIHWSTDEPRLAFPIDVIFYNFLLPFVIRKAEPSKKVAAMYKWWFRGCAHGLRLTHFLIGDDREEEKGTHVRKSWRAKLHLKQGDTTKPVIGEDRRILAEDRQVDAYFFRDGTYVRAPASDSLRIPKGEQVFLEVDEHNHRLDGKPDHDKGIHGIKDERFQMVYIPPKFRARIATFILLMWLFAATTGVTFTIGPLLLGRRILKYLASSDAPPNDLYAFTIGIHLTGAVSYIVSSWQVVRDLLKRNTGQYLENLQKSIPEVYAGTKYVLGLIYVGLVFGVVFPFTFSLLAELYLHVPFYTFLITSITSRTDTVIQPSEARASLETSSSLPATVFILQTWTLGFLYMRIVLRIILYPTDNPTRAARAVRAIIRNGTLQPDIGLATRAFIVPATAVCTFFLLAPLALGRLVIATQLHDPTLTPKVYRYSYPGLLAAAIVVYCALLVRSQIASWRTKIRDEMYLIGERLHNFQEVQRSAVGEERPKVERVRTGDRVDILG